MPRAPFHRNVWLSAFLLFLASGSDVPTMAQPEGLLCAARDIVGQYETPGEAGGIVIAGDYAYVADGVTGLVIVDISVPTAPAFVSSVETSGPALRVALGGTHAFVAVGSMGVRVVDISDPGAPIVVASLDRDGFVSDVVTDGNLLYMVDGDGLVIVDTSDPVNPVVVSQLTTPGWVSRLCVEESIVYVAGENAGVHVVDVTNPSSPVLVGSFDPGGVVDVDAEPGLAYVVREFEMIVLDMADPANPEPAGSVELLFRPQDDIVVESGRVYIDGGRVVLDVSDPAQPTLLGSSLSVAKQAVIRGSLAFTAADTVVEIVDVSEPPQSGVLGNISSNDGMEGVDISGSYAFVAEFGNGMSVIDISDPAAPVRVASVDTGGFTHDVVVQGNYAYAVDRDLFIFDVSDPTQPILQNEPNGLGGSRLDVDGDIAVVSGSLLRFFDIRNPAEPVLLVSRRGIDGRTHGQVRVESGYAFTAGGGEFHIYDLSVPEDDPVAIVYGTRSALDVDTGLGIACVGTSAGVGIFDIQDPAAPLLLGEFELLGSYAESIKIFGDNILVGLHDGQVWLADISNPASPRRIVALDAWYRSPSTIWDIAIAENRAYALSYPSGLTILDLSDCPPCPADFNGDGVIDTHDFIAFLGAWASERGEDCSAGDCSADLTGDGVVDTRDFVEFLSFWTDGC